MSINPTLFYWKRDKLFYGQNLDTGYSIFHNGKGYQLCWPDAVLSTDFYNKTRVRDHAITKATEDMLKIV